ncbi:MAG: SDR family oxidoreductase [Aquisalimonadaceae bacterium]
MDLGLKGKTALVTGGSRGIGKAIARALAREGVRVAICARDKAACDAAANALARETGGDVHGFQADMSSAEDINRLMAEVTEALGGTDILINNAARVGGTGGPDSLAELNESMIQADFNTKVMGYLRAARAVASYMQRRAWGRIVNIDGMAARVAGGISGGIRNAAVANMSKVMSEELGPKGITVNVVHPAATATSDWEQRLEVISRRQNITIDQVEANMAGKNAIRRLVDVDELGAVVTFLCSHQAAGITGECIAVSGGASSSVTY